MVTAKELLVEATERLKSREIGTPQLDAEVILCNLLEVDRVKLLIYPDMEISREICKKFWENVERRMNYEPIQYIVNRQEFMGLDLFVDKGVLIPRGDTEILVEKVLEVYGNEYAPEFVNILDIGTGSGAITVSLAKLIENCHVTSIDISPRALEIASKNAAIHGVEGKIDFLNGDLFGPLKDGDEDRANPKEGNSEEVGSKLEFIVSNPPYIPDRTIKSLSPQVKEHEPLLALVGGEDGLDFYRKIIDQSPDYLVQGGYLVLEIGYNQGKSVSSLMKERGFKDVEVIEDLASHDRVVIGRIM